MWSPDELALLHRYQPLLEAELRRIGVSEADERWMHAGSDRPPTEELLEAREWMTADVYLWEGRSARRECSILPL